MAGGPGSFAAALTAADHGAGPSMTPGVPDASGRTIGWDSPDPNQVCPPAPAAAFSLTLCSEHCSH